MGRAGELGIDGKFPPILKISNHYQKNSLFKQFEKTSRLSPVFPRCP